MPAIPDIPKVFYIAVLLYRGASQGGRISHETGLYTEETWLDGATLNSAVSLVDDGNLVCVYQIEPAKGQCIGASTQVANAWFVRNAPSWSPDRPWPDFISAFCEFPLHRQEPGKKYYSSTEDSPH